MSLSIIEQDVVSGLSLLKDGNDPPRFYVQWRKRRELIAIGDEGLARSRFAAWKGRRSDTVKPSNGFRTFDPATATAMATGIPGQELKLGC